MALLALCASLGVQAASSPREVSIPDSHAFPESITSTSDGALIIGSLDRGMVFRAAPGAPTAEPWINPGSNGLKAVFGVLADERSGTLWVCSNKSPRDTTPSPEQQSALKTFDLKTGAAKASYPFPGEAVSMCNDIAIGPDGAAYVTDTVGARILRLRPGAATLEVWLQSPDMTGNLDGIAFGNKSTLCVNAYDTGRLYRIKLKPDGRAGAITQPSLSRPLELPDGMRPVGRGKFLLIEGAGRLTRLTFDGDTVRVDTLKDGFTAPTGVTRVKGMAWVVEGKLSHVFDPKLRDQDPGPFNAYAVRLRGGD